MRLYRVLLFLSIFFLVPGEIRAAVEEAVASTSDSKLGYRVVADYDDTVKISNAGSWIGLVWEHFSAKGIFPGMAELLSAVEMRAQSLTYLSGSPEKMLDSVSTLIKSKGLPHGEIQLRCLKKHWTTYTFKKQALDRIVTNSAEPFVLIGDDTQYDPEIYDDLKRMSPERVLTIYIHRVENRKIPENIFYYSTPFEVALNEYRSGRISREQTLHIGDLLSKSEDMGLLFPDFKHCPEDFKISLEEISDPELESLTQSVIKKVSDHCRQRQIDQEEWAEQMQELWC